MGEGKGGVYIFIVLYSDIWVSVQRCPSGMFRKTITKQHSGIQKKEKEKHSVWTGS